MRLDRYDARGFDRGASRLKELLWLATSAVLVGGWLPGSGWRVRLLRLFGARIGRGVVVKPGVRVKFPWRLVVGDHCWIGEDAWIDNLAEVRLGDYACLSQAAYLCTGSHDWSREGFDLVTAPIRVESHAWVCARATLAPGSVLREGAVLGLGSVGRGELAPWTVHSGRPAAPLRARVVAPSGVRSGAPAGTRAEAPSTRPARPISQA